MTQIERRQARIRRIRDHLDRTRAARSDHAESGAEQLDETENSGIDPATRYHIGKTQNNPEHIVLFIQKSEKDPAVKVSSPVEV